MKFVLIGITALILTASAALADGPAKTADSSLGKILVTPAGMTLYSFDNDQKGAASTCTDKCIAAWPPFVAPADAAAMGEWSTADVVDKDGKAEKMWAYNGSPLYTFIKDTKPGDVAGDGIGGVWHVIKEK